MSEYVECHCEVCGWTDGFLTEIIGKDGKTTGYCDKCEDVQQFKIRHAKPQAGVAKRLEE